MDGKSKAQCRQLDNCEIDACGAIWDLPLHARLTSVKAVWKASGKLKGARNSKGGRSRGGSAVQAFILAKLNFEVDFHYNYLMLNLCENAA